MDILSEILASVRSVSPLLADLRMGGSWGIDMEESSPGTPFHYVASGSCWLLVDGGERMHLSTGDLVILPPWPRHALASASDVPLRPIRQIVAELGYPSWTPETGIEQPIDIESETPFDVEILSGIFGFDSVNAAFLTDTLPKIMHLRAPQHELAPWLDATLELTRGEAAKTVPGFSAVAGRAMEFIFIHAMRSWMLEHAQTSGWLAGLMDTHIGSALKAMHGSPNRNWSLSELARTAGQSRAIFAARFRALTGETPFGYLTRWRMSQAAARLTRSNEAISTISEALGYSSAFTLSRAFRAQFKCTPAEFRRHHRSARQGRSSGDLIGASALPGVGYP